MNQAQDFAEEWDNSTKLVQPSVIKKPVKTPELEAFIKSWIDAHTTPSSNTREVKKVVENGVTFDHVIHWRTESIDAMFEACRYDAERTLDQTFEKTYFFAKIPSYVKLKKHQDGLCPIHHTGINVEKEFKRKRRLWHTNCDCQCAFCSKVFTYSKIKNGAPFSNLL